MKEHLAQTNGTNEVLTRAKKETKRAIALSGGGPTVALHIGALEYFENHYPGYFTKEKDVWTLSCIGAWAGIVYNQFKERNAARTRKFFRDRVFRDDTSYARFPINAVFGPDLITLSTAATRFLLDYNNYDKLWLPDKILDAVNQTMLFLFDRRKWNEGDFSKLILEYLAANPYVRFVTSFAYLSQLNGLSRMYYKNSSFLRSIDFEELKSEGKPFIIHNAYKFGSKDVDIFVNRDPPSGRKYPKITAQSLCACSALPYIEETVLFEDGSEYCEGALIDTLNFSRLLEDHPDVEEIWVSKIVSYEQIKQPKTITDALGNLCMLFAATVAEDDLKLFKYHARLNYKQIKGLDRPWRGKIIEMNYAADPELFEQTNFGWSHRNFDACIKAGEYAARAAVESYPSIEAKARDEIRGWQEAFDELKKF